ncbi:MAG TPA: Ig-like domain-containing protein, partial [Desulfuromonadaceae bacterium]|nr:Ig-like domain-containing protein [Desulfuromonadaceae bacterium]
MKNKIFSIILPVVFLIANASASVPVTATKTNSLSVDVNGNGRANPGDTIKHNVTITAGGLNATNVQFVDPLDPNTTFVPGSLHASPVAFDDSYTAVGNTKLYVGTTPPLGEPALVSGASGLLANDVIATAPDLISFSGFSGATTQGGSVTVNAAGNFTYTPPVGFTGTDTFTYTNANNVDGTLKGVGTVTITVNSRIWYIDNSAGSGNGTSASPFNSLSAVSGASGSDTNGDIIYIATGAGNYTGGIVLSNNQTLWGQSEALVVNGFTLQTAGSDPVIANASGNGITLASGNTIKGLTVGSTTTGGIVGGTVGTLTVTNVTLNGPGPLFTVGASGALNVVLDSATTTSSTTTGISLTGVTGSFTVLAGSISGVAGDDFVVNGGTANITYPGTINNSAGHSVNIQNHTSGTILFSGNITDSGTGILVQNNSGGSTTFSGATKSLSTGTSPAINLASNTGHTIGFTNGFLNITTTTGTGFAATGGGTVSVVGISNIISSGNGTALDVANTTIGASGLTFQSISSSGGSATGIILDTTGSNGLTVTGSGSAGSGGTISGKTGSDGSMTTGVGIYLSACAGVSLSRMQLNDFQNYAIRGNGVTNFILNDSIVDSTGGGWNGNNAAGGFNEGSIVFSNLVGSVGVTNTAISGGFADNFRVVNTVGTLNRVVFETVTIGPNSSGAALDGSQDQGNDGITLESQSAAVINATVHNSTFTSARGDLFQLNNIGTVSDDLIFTGNHLSNNYVRIATGGGGVTISDNGSGGITYNIVTNTFRDAVGPAILLVKSTGGSSVTGTFNGNSIGLPGVVNSGSLEGDDLKIQNAGQGTVSMVVTNNSIYQYNNFGIDMVTGGGAS